jgi:hypothetical protein
MLSCSAPPFTFTDAQRRGLVQSLLDDVRTPSKRIGQSGQLAIPPFILRQNLLMYLPTRRRGDRAQYCQDAGTTAIHCERRHISGGEQFPLLIKFQLSLLLQNMALLASIMKNGDQQVAYNAMKVIANTLLLILDSALDNWLATGGPAAAINVLEV